MHASHTQQPLASTCGSEINKSFNISELSSLSKAVNTKPQVDADLLQGAEGFACLSKSLEYIPSLDA